MKKLLVLSLTMAVVVAMCNMAAAFPGFAVNTGNSCGACHDGDNGGSDRDGAVSVLGEKIVDLGTELDGHVRGPLQTFTGSPGDTVTLSVEVLDGRDHYAVQLKRLEKPGQLNSMDNFLVYGADGTWDAQGPAPSTYFTQGPEHWDGPVVYSYDLFIDPATPFDTYDLEFAAAGRLDEGRLKFYGDEHFYLEVVPVPEPATFALLGTGLCALGLCIWRRRKNAA